MCKPLLVGCWSQLTNVLSSTRAHGQPQLMRLSNSYIFPSFQ